MQSERVQLDEQARVKDIEFNRLKSVKMELEQDLRDCRQTVDRVSHSCQLADVYSLHFLKIVFHWVALQNGYKWSCLCVVQHCACVHVLVHAVPYLYPIHENSPVKFYQ